MKKKVAIASIYLIGMFSFFLVDFIVARYESNDAIAKWALVKSTVMIGGTLVLFGMDQVMVRLPKQAIDILKRSYFQIFIAAVLYAIFVQAIGLLQEGIWFILAVFTVALSTLYFGYYRSQLFLLNAQIVTNGWKPVFLIALILFLFFDIPRNYSLIFIIATSLSLVVAGFLKNGNVTNFKTHDSEPVRGQYSLGARFFISLMSLNLSLYLEQVLLNSGSHTSASTIYFSHFAIILPLMVLFNGYVGFLLGPYIRKDVDKFDSLLSRFWWVLPASALFLGAASFLLAIYSYSWLLNAKSEFIYPLGFIIAGIGVLRIVYILPSSYLGVVAPKVSLDRFVIVNSFGVVVLVGGFYTLYHLTNSALYSIAYASLLNWLIRTGYGNYLVWTIWHTRRVESSNVSK